MKRYQKHFVSFSDLSPEEESQLYTVDKPFESEKDDNSFSVGGNRITPELLVSLHIAERKRNAVILYYFHDMSDADIAKLYNIPRSTVQHRRTSSFSSLKKFLRNAQMMKQNGNTSEQSERGLLPYVVIVAATKGDPEAMKMVVQHYEGYIRTSLQGRSKTSAVIHITA